MDICAVTESCYRVPAIAASASQLPRGWRLTTKIPECSVVINWNAIEFKGSAKRCLGPRGRSFTRLGGLDRQIEEHECHSCFIKVIRTK